MPIKKTVGRPVKVDYKIIIKLADAIQHNATITEACRYAGISRDTFYRHFKFQQVFAEKINQARKDQNKFIMSFQTIF